MSAEYKVGDRVRIIKRTRGASDYRFHFTNEMAELEGRVYEISHIGGTSMGPCPVPDDGYCYSLKGSGGFNWASSMFESVEETPPPSKEEPKVLDFTPKKKHYQLNFSV